MKHLTPVRLVWLGFFLMVLGIVLPFLMVIHVIESTLLLNFIAYLASFGGLLVGLVGVVTWTRLRRPDNDEGE